MASTSTKILTAEQEAKLRQPIDEYVGKIQDQINDLREDGTDKVIEIQSAIDSLKRDKIYTAQEKEARIRELQSELEKAKAVENRNKDAIAKLISDAENYLKAHFNTTTIRRLSQAAETKRCLRRRNTARRLPS